MDIEDRDRWLSEHASEVVRGEGCDLLELNVRRQGSRSTVAVTVDRRGTGVSLDDCARVSRSLGSFLESRQRRV